MMHVTAAALRTTHLARGYSSAGLVQLSRADLQLLAFVARLPSQQFVMPLGLDVVEGGVDYGLLLLYGHLT